MTARTVPTMPTWTAGQRVLASQLQSITTFANYQANAPMFRMHQSVAQSIPNATFTVITMDTLDYDTDSGRAVATPWAYTIPASGRWTFTIHIVFASGAASERDVGLFKNSAVVLGSDETSATASAASNLVTLTIPCNAGDVMAAGGFQQTGGALNTFAGGNVLPTFEGRLVSLANP